jgi:hypothetical protein
VYGYQPYSGAGSGYGIFSSRSAVNGYISYGNEYSFGVTGYTWGDDTRTGGVFGGSSSGNPPSAWGALGYKASNYIHYGGYGTTGWTSGSGKAGVGCGFYGDLMGGWLRGEIYGAYIQGERYGLYTKGNAFIEGYAGYVDEIRNERVVSYIPAATSAQIMTCGIGELSSGRATIRFDENFSKIVSKSEPIIVTVTPIGEIEYPICVVSVDNNGFTVKEKSGKSNIKFYYIAIGKREIKTDVPQEILAVDFDNNMERFAFNESNTKENALGMWWDGNSLRWGTPPEPPKPPKKPELEGVKTAQLTAIKETKQLLSIQTVKITPKKSVSPVEKGFKEELK